MALFALEHSGLWEAFLVMGIAGIGIGFTFAAMPGFIVQAVDAPKTPAARWASTRCCAASAWPSAARSAASSSPATPMRIRRFPTVGGFRTTLLLGGALCLLTAVHQLRAARSLPRRAAAIRSTPTRCIAMEENAEIAGAGLMLADARSEGQPS